MQKTTFKSVLSLMTLAILSAFMSISFQSCSKADDDGGDPDASSFIGKWTVANPSDNGYGSFEFTGDKKYIITQRTTTPPSTRSVSTRASETVYIIIIFGDISSLNGSGNEYTLNLSEFGTITINIGSNGTATVTVNGETYTTEKEQEIVASDKTELLCHTWNIKHDEDADYYIEHTVTFSKSGTYLVYIKDVYASNVGEEYGYGTWEWNNKGQTEMYCRTLWDDGDDSGYGIMKILELTDKYMKVEDTYTDSGGKVYVEIIECYRD
jgi:hypothetical protein